jgi:hypothetical protein
LQGLFGMGEELVSFVGVDEGEVGGVVVGYLGLPAGGQFGTGGGAPRGVALLRVCMDQPARVNNFETVGERI